MKKKFLISALALSLSLTNITLPVRASELADNNSTIVTADTNLSNASARIVHSYQKTVTKSYSSLDSIPESIPYSEYNMSTWFSGTLYVSTVTRTSSGSYTATFTGTLIGNL